jgi:hypothetical protein
LREALKSWDITTSPPDSAPRIVFLRKSLKFGGGVALGDLKKFLIDAAVELKAALKESE